MEMLRRNLNGSNPTIDYLSVLTNQEYNALIVEKSLEGDGYHVVFGESLTTKETDDRQYQDFKAFASNGKLIDTKLV